MVGVKHMQWQLNLSSIFYPLWFMIEGNSVYIYVRYHPHGRVEDYAKH